MSRTTEEEFDALHRAVANRCKVMVENDECTASELSAAIKFLKDNGIEHKPVPGDPQSILDDADQDIGDMLPAGLKHYNRLSAVK